MRIAFITDIHVCTGRLAGVDGQAALLEGLGEAIRGANPDLVLVGGDLAGTTVPHRATPEERNALVDFLAPLAQEIPVVVCRGNHDYPGDYDFLNRLQGRLFYSDAPELLGESGSWYVMALPWLDRGMLDLNVPYATAVRDAYASSIAAAQEEILEARQAGVPVILLGHAALASASLRPGQPITPVEDPIQESASLLDPKFFDVAFFGHYHMYQKIDGAVPAWYGGSTFVNEYGEPTPKGWLFYDTVAKEIEFHPIVQPTKVKVVWDPVVGQVLEVKPEDTGWITAGMDAAALALVREATCHLKLVVRVPEEQLAVLTEPIARVRADLGAACLSVKQEVSVIRRATMRDGAEEVAKAPSVEAKVGRAMAEIRPVPSKKDWDRTLEIFREIEAST